MASEKVIRGVGEWRGSFTSIRKVSKTRGRHKCVKCRDYIITGSPAARYSGVFEAQFFSEYAHSECAGASEN